MHKKEKIQKVNFGLYPTSIKKAQELALKLDRSISGLIRILIEEAHKKELNKAGDINVGF